MRNAHFMSANCRKACSLCSSPIGGTSQKAWEAAAAAAAAREQSVRTEAAIATPAAAESELIGWLTQRGLTAAAHLPILQALGAVRVNGRVGSLKSLRVLTFTEMSNELRAAGPPALPCAPRCAADKAAVFEALQADLLEEKV